MQLISGLFGGGNGDLLAQQQSNQRRSLAQLAAEQGKVDQAAAGGATARGGRLLKFITNTGLSGSGQATLG